MNNTSYQICNYCIMDTSDEDIKFDAKGRCNHCTDFEQVLNSPRYHESVYDKQLNSMISKIKNTNKQYDCLVGISGGVDSCYTAYLCHKWGLKPLLIHMDNGWNSDIAVKNVKKIVDKLDLDYVSYVLDWKEFREVQLGFIKSGIVDIEMPTDIGIAASLYKTASKYKIKYIVSGGNLSGEGILPLTWGYHVLKDKKLYKHIVKTYSTLKIKKLPIVGLLDEIYFKFFKRIKTVYPLNIMEYNKDKARDFLIKEFDWKDYGGKHHESKITGFWQSYIMPTKYNMDYRRATYSSQIVSGQMTRDEALEKIKKPSFDAAKIPADKDYISKKYDVSREKFDTILKSTPKTYKDFPNNKLKIERFYNLYRRMYDLIK
ncbi:N-acetyl sugar amidotransferase [Flavobacteriales bacterium]|nr:N-acetyl sugar amidotransferase [Flavobacteriales bacterium]